MADLVSASKTLKALGKNGEALKCVESDPSEVLRESLKTVGKAAGPIIQQAREKNRFATIWPFPT